MYFVFRFADDAIIETFLQRFSHHIPEYKSIMSAALVKTNDDQNKDVPFMGLLVRKPNDGIPPPSVPRVFELAAKCMKFEPEMTAVRLPLLLMLNGPSDYVRVI